ncbi:hypothetical protein L227DRAFT_615117 [Lentinus tigrinus ALCF2SS1-6]|uniref:Uncharacterized protein n=1 Tax=Lentinus tigrinus ALCF2SS1-6 TaxID=1328759 RepID=A0A5C2RXD9_9APHY|nr:hypothetical protein L227DRAFT_615117 [Lentinus tigrinus ALCF2SS1-6]
MPRTPPAPPPHPRLPRISASPLFSHPSASRLSTSGMIEHLSQVCAIPTGLDSTRDQDSPGYAPVTPTTAPLEPRAYDNV